VDHPAHICRPLSEVLKILIVPILWNKCILFASDPFPVCYFFQGYPETACALLPLIKNAFLPPLNVKLSLKIPQRSGNLVWIGG
jgi:hypothetical protein